jgi:hypothetical protein
MRRRESHTNITALNPEPNTVAAVLGAVLTPLLRSSERDTLVAGTISGVTTAHPVLRVRKGAYFISKKNKGVPCVLK